MCASTRCEVIWPASSWRLRSFQAGSMLRNTPGVSRSPYHPTPKPSPFVVSAPSCKCRLCTTSEFLGLYSSSSMRTGAPEYASQRHTADLLVHSTAHGTSTVASREQNPARGRPLPPHLQRVGRRAQRVILHGQS